VSVLVTAPQPFDTAELQFRAAPVPAIAVHHHAAHLHPRHHHDARRGARRGDTFSVASDKPFMTISPSSGPLPPEGATVTATIDLTRLDVGSTQGSVTINRAPAAGKVGALGDPPAPINVPVSVSVVAPVTRPRRIRTPDSMRCSSRRGARERHRLAFRQRRPHDQHRIAVDQLSAHLHAQRHGRNGHGQQINAHRHAGDTKALNDIVKDWYGSGELGEAPQRLAGNPSAPTSRARTPSTSTWPPSPPVGRTASHRTGTFGQYVPALPLVKLPFES